jgi:tetrapyrrole methylase family protein/MazG family protein
VPPVLDVVGLGPAGPDLLTEGTRSLIAAASTCVLRTFRHPAAEALRGSLLRSATSFDHRYAAAESMEEVYGGIVDDLVALATAAADSSSSASSAPVVYAVPGSPVVAEHTVELLLADDRVDVRLHPAMSFLDLTWVRLGLDPVERGVQLVDGHRFTTAAAGLPGPLLVAQCDHRFVLSDIKLAVDPMPTEPVVVLHHLGLPDEQVLTVPWEDLDRAVDADHLTSVLVPELGAPVGGEVVALSLLVERLRGLDPWKTEQTHDSLKRYLLEEAHEVFDAIDAYDPETGEGADELCGELGDLLYQVVFHATIGAEAGWFTLGDVAASIRSKLEHRHPHLDEDVAATDVPEIAALETEWERAKRVELGRSSAFDGIPASLPALARALKVARKAEALGLVDGSATGPDDEGSSLVAAADALIAAPADPALVGELLGLVVESCRRSGVDPEDALRQRTLRVEARYRSREEP